ncbi:MAG TPA: hypothetical protein PKM43_11945 [Verrucomicrobiota bacterium]|nr:hypothetical protein [Verrucomicrobiota bacterium]
MEGEKAALDRLCGPGGEHERLFHVGFRDIKATSFVGVVQLGQRVVQVLPKMHRPQLDERRDRAECERQATANLLFLLSYTGKLRVTEPEIAHLTRRSTPLSEVLYWLFASQLWKAVSRELLRGYVTVEERLDAIKGRWRVTAQAQRPDCWRRDRFDVAYDEFTEDNLPNRLFRATALRMTRWAQWSETRSHLAQLRSVLADVMEITPQPPDFPTAAQWIQRYRRRAGEGQMYRPLLKLAEMFWTGAGPQPSPGRLDSFAFMFDMNQLFEEFIAEFIRRELREVWQSRGWTFHAQSGTRHLLRDESGKDRFRLTPDIRFETDNNETTLILDTKYKLLDTTAARLGVAEADAYQMFAYAKRYDCPRVALLYPQTVDKIVFDFSADTHSPPWLEVRTVDLRREFVMSQNREVFAQDLKSILWGRKETQ